MAVLFNLFLLSCFTLLCFTTSTTSLATTSPIITKPKRLVTKLIHHNSIQGVSLDTDDVRAGVFPEPKDHGFMANISIGSPPVPQLLIMDTCSSVSWTQCQPCTPCFSQALPIFNPTQSATYRLLPCSSTICHQAPRMICPALRCEFELRYGNATFVSGYLGSEKITFESSDKGITSCNGGGNLRTADGQSGGVLGLGPEMTSLVKQVGSKLSYCLGSIWDLQYSHNQLIIGDGARIEGPSSPITIFGSSYYVTLESVSVGEKKLDISPQVFKLSKEGTGGVIIDSGSTLTYIPKAAFDPLEDEVLSLMDGLVQFVGTLKSGPCFRGVIDRDLVGFPVVTFTFANGVDMALDVKSFFYPVESNSFLHVCVLAQQSYNIAYDLAGNTVSIQRIDCELLE
ncbi:hypothetical protein ACB092_12G186500 [Castanea dentata]